MRNLDVRAVGAVKASDRRTLAMLAYDNATADPDSANWRSVAELLRACLPTARKTKDAGLPTWWADYDLNSKFTTESLAVAFADGRTVRVNLTRNPGKPRNIGRALRTAFAFYRNKVFGAVGYPQPSYATTVNAWDAHVTVPEIVTVTVIDTGDTFDAAECTRLTAEKRAGTWSLSEALAAAAHLPAQGPEVLRSFDPVTRRWEWPETRETAIRASYIAAWRAAYQAAEDAVLRTGKAVPAKASEPQPDPAELYDACLESFVDWADNDDAPQGDPEPDPAQPVPSAPIGTARVVNLRGPSHRAPAPPPVRVPLHRPLRMQLRLLASTSPFALRSVH